MAPTVALAGNSRQHVGNYPGVTVEKKEGTYVRDGFRLHIVDLPGTYSLTAYSLEEVVTRDFLVNQKPEVVINIVDASNLERNLYLAIQFDLHRPQHDRCGQKTGD
jgi:ferrous iron transport protein B